MECPKCLLDCKKAGKRSDGFQRYRCSRCGKTYSERKPKQRNLFAHTQAVDEDRALLALNLLVEGNSIRGTQRIVGIDKKTIMRLLVNAGKRCEVLLASKINSVPVADVQCDEIWSYVQKKESRRVFGDKNFHYIGDAWTFIAIERNTKLVLTYELGKRNTQSASRFMEKLSVAAGSERFQLSTDGFQPYNYAVGTKLDGRCDYGQLVKVYAAPTAEEAAALQPRARSRVPRHGSIRRPKPRQNLHKSYRTAERIAAPMVQAAYEINVCVQQKVGPSESGAGLALRVLQLLPEAQQPEGRYSCDGCGDYGQGLGIGGIN